MTVRAKIHLGALVPDDVLVELYMGAVNADEDLVESTTLPMTCMKQDGKFCLFEGGMPLEMSGRVGFSLRILPAHPDLAHHQDCMLITWA